MEIGKIKKALSDFAKKVKNVKNWKEKPYREKEIEIADTVGKLKSRGSNLRLRRDGVSDFEDDEFYGFAAISNRRRISPRRICKKQLGAMSLIS